MAALAARTKLASGDLFDGRFRLLRELAAGSMGAVWEAEDLHRGMAVALKVLHSELHEERAIRRRFRREASILQSIVHPSLVRIFDFGHAIEWERSYAIMELLHGETLESRLHREKNLAPSTLAPLVRAIADGLSVVHSHGIIHGDLKPSNLFLAEPAESPVKIVDFGLSKIEGLERLTRTGELTGTPVYLAPELLKGERDIDTRVDQYALAIVVYEALAGRLPFEPRRHPGALMFEIVTGKGTSLMSIAPRLGEPLSAVIARAMAPSPEARFPDVASFSAAFASAVSALEGVD